MSATNIDYKYSEGKLLKQISEYIDETYSEHYSRNKFQTTEFIIDNGHGIGFTAGNVMKYVQRYGKKDGRNRKDILKIIHYAIMMLHVHDLETGQDAQINIFSPPEPNSTSNWAERFRDAEYRTFDVIHGGYEYFDADGKFLGRDYQVLL